MEQQYEREHYNVDDYRQWEGDWELIEGAPHAMVPSPTVQHQGIAGALHAQLHQTLEDCPHCQVFFEIDVEFSDHTVVRPDVLVICYTPEGERLTRAPDLIFEVVSSRDARGVRRDEFLKFRIYREEGVGHYVLVYPEARKAKVYRLVDGAYQKVGDFSDTTHRFDLSRCSVEVDFSRLWRRKGMGNAQ